jgi:hypothetical protein
MPARHFQVWCRALAALWIVAVVVASALATARHPNTFEIFRTASHNLLGGHDLYGGSTAHRDYFDYSPSFALLFAPFAVLPLWLGVLLWNALNAGTLYWSLGRVLAPQQALAARAIVALDTLGSIQSTQSNALCAGLIVLAFAEMERRRQPTAALSIALGTIIKIFPLAAGAFAVFRPRQLPTFAAWSVAIGLVFVAAPLVVLSPAELAAQYRSWLALQPATASLEYSVMDQLRLWFGVRWPYWPIQLVGVAVLIAPFCRAIGRVEEQTRFRLRCLASLLMFCVLFNHKAESPTFVIAAAGAAIWFAVSERDRRAWTLLAIVLVGTVLSSSDAMPHPVQERLFEPYRLKTLPILALWLVVQWELWRQTAPVAHQAHGFDRVIRAT